MTPSYDLPAPYTDMFGHYDLVSRQYSLTGFIAETGGLRHTKPLAEREWTADSLAGSRRSLTQRGRSPSCNGAPCSWRLPRAGCSRLRPAPPHRRPPHLARRARHAGAAQPARARTRLLTGLARAGKRVVAVGQRGHVLLSDDAGKSWQQADVPVSADLVAVSFANAEAGWAVGHDGVVLHSADAGRTWTRQLDGRDAWATCSSRATRKSGDDKWLAEAKRFAAQGAENPFLDVWFDDASNGYRRRRVRPGAAHRRRRRDLGAAAACRPTTPRACTCTRCAASAASSSSPASRACCSSSTATAGASRR